MNISEQTYFVLASLLDGRQHGYGVIKMASELSNGKVKLAAGTLYGALDRLVANELVEVDGEESIEGRLRRYYRLTDSGRDQLEEHAERLAHAAAVVQVRLSPPRSPSSKTPRPEPRFA